MRTHDTQTDCYFNLREAADYIGVSTRFLHYQLKKQDYAPPGFRLGTRWLFRKSELDVWLELFRARGV